MTAYSGRERVDKGRDWRATERKGVQVPVSSQEKRKPRSSTKHSNTELIRHENGGQGEA